MSLYNKYRPKSFDDLATNKFNQNLKKENLTHHSYLFFGPPGTGKTSTARLCMAQYNPKKIESCISGNHPDYVEINCAVKNGVDDIRTVISDVVNTMPIDSPYKFVVFDESHMLTTQASNALLKTVEEPPSHIKFFFCTTEVNKVIPAIRSRCQLVPFLKITESKLESILKNISEQENMEYASESLKMISGAVDGSARAAINYLEQYSSLLNEPQEIGKLLGTASKDSFYSLTKFICTKNRVEALKSIDALISDSMDVNSLMNKYADYIADLILCRLKDKEFEFDGKKLLVIANCVTGILKDFKILQNIKLISKIHVLEAIDKIL